jgi:tetratricopeptide (TPR) repeat protein
MSSHLDYEINKELGECYLFMGDLDKAEEYYRKAAGSNGKHPDPYLGLATIAVQRNDLDTAHTLYRKAADIDPDDKSLSGMALVEMERGEHENAFDNFEGALKKNPENLIAIYCMVQLGHVLGRLPQVVGYLEDYLSIDPMKSDVRFALAGCLQSMGQVDTAIKHLESVLENDPGHEASKELLDTIRS